MESFIKRIRHKSVILVVFLTCVFILFFYAYYRDVIKIPLVSDYISNIREESAEYEVYSVYINAQIDYMNDNANSDNRFDDIKLVLISKNGDFKDKERALLFFDESEVFTEEKLDRIDRAYPEIEKETLRSFWQKNSKPINLEPKFDLKKNYKVIDVSQFKKDKFDSTSSAIREKYPESYGVYKFARIGFNKDFTEALLYIENDRGPMSSSGGGYLLEKKNGKWESKKHLRIWYQ